MRNVGHLREDRMFDFFKKKRQPPPAPYADRRWFIAELFDKVRLRPTPEKRLEGYIDLWERTRDLEHEFDVHCLELEFERDRIEDAFYECSDPDTIYACAIAYGVLLDKGKVVTAVVCGNLLDHLKARLLKIHIRSEIEQLKFDPREFDPALQHAFYEVERRELSTFEKRKILETEFGITEWRSEQEMNPHIIYD